MSRPEWSLETQAGPHALEQIHRALDGLWSDHEEIPDAIRMQLGIAVAEIGANIIEHAGRGRPVRVRMDMDCLDNQVQIEFTDEGQPADVDLDSLQMPDQTAERGRGLALARAVLSQLTYRRSDGANHWTLVSERFG